MEFIEIKLYDTRIKYISLDFFFFVPISIFIVIQLFNIIFKPNLIVKIFHIYILQNLL